MAISFVSATTPLVTTTTPATISVTLPSGIQDGDFLMLWVTGQNAYVPSGSPPSGWTFHGWAYVDDGGTGWIELDLLYIESATSSLSGTTVSVPVTYDTVGTYRTTAVVTVYRSSLGRGLRLINTAGNNSYNATNNTSYQWPYTNPGPGSIKGVVGIGQLPPNSASTAPPAATSFTTWSSTAYTNMQMWGYHTTADYAVGSVAPERIFTSTTTSTTAMVSFQVHLMEKQFGWTHADSLNLARSPTYTSRFGQLAQDQAKLRDGVSPLWQAVRAVSEGLQLADATTWALGALLTEMLPLGDTLGPQTTYQQVVADAMRVVDAMQRGVPVTLTEQIQLARAVVAVRALSVIEGLGLAETLAGALTLKVTQTERMGFTENLMRFLGGTIVDGLGMHQTDAALRATLGMVTEGLGVAGTLAPKLLIRVDAADSITLEDAEVLKLIFKPVVAEGLEISAAYLSPNGNFTAWAVNTETGATTEYTNFAFNSFAQVGHKAMATSNTGLYELVGDTDNGTDIIAAIKSGYMQMNDSRFTGLKAVYLGVRGGGEYFLKLETPQGSTTYRVLAEDMATTKVWVGKGLRTRYLSFELISTGQDFDLESIEFVPMRATRRV